MLHAECRNEAWSANDMSDCPPGNVLCRGDVSAGCLCSPARNRKVFKQDWSPGHWQMRGGSV